MQMPAWLLPWKPKVRDMDEAPPFDPYEFLGVSREPDLMAYLIGPPWTWRTRHRERPTPEAKEPDSL